MELKLADSFKRNWKVNQECLIDSQHKYKPTKGIISFIYCPRTGEFNLGLEERHKELVTDFKTPLSDFIRGIYIKGDKVVLRAFSEEGIENFNRQYDTIEALGLHSFKIKFNASSDELYSQYCWQ